MTGLSGFLEQTTCSNCSDAPRPEASALTRIAVAGHAVRPQAIDDRLRPRQAEVHGAPPTGRQDRWTPSRHIRRRKSCRCRAWRRTPSPRPPPAVTGSRSAPEHDGGGLAGRRCRHRGRLRAPPEAEHQRQPDAAAARPAAPEKRPATVSPAPGGVEARGASSRRRTRRRPRRRARGRCGSRPRRRRGSLERRALHRLARCRRRRCSGRRNRRHRRTGDRRPRGGGPSGVDPE